MGDNSPHLVRSIVRTFSDLTVATLTLAVYLAHAGMEVIYTGPRQTAEMILNTAIQEDVDIIGLSFLGGSHKEHTVKITDLMKKTGMSDVVLLAGGIIPSMDIDYLKSLGVDEVFGPGSDIDVIVKTTLELLKKKREGGH